MSAALDSVAAYRGDLLRYAGTLTRDTHLAEDLVHDTIAKAIAGIDAYRGEAALRTWLHRILYRSWVDHLRRSREDPHESVADEVEAAWRDDAWTVDAAAVAERARQRDELRDALARLPYHYAAAVVLHDAEGLRALDVAEIQGATLAAAKQRIRRGRMMLVAALADGDARRRELEGQPMDCWSARRGVSDYLDDELDQEERAALESHLESCPTCPPLYAALVSGRDGVRALGRPAHGAAGLAPDPDSVVPPELADRLRTGSAND